MKEKPKKWAAQSLVSETEKKSIISPKKQRELGVLTAEAVLGGGAGFLAKQVGKQVVKKLATRAADKKAKKSGEKIIHAEFEDDLLRAYNKAHPKAKKTKAKHWMYKDLGYDETTGKYKPPAKGSGPLKLSGKPPAKVSKNKLSKAKGGSVKKYAKGGGVRKAR